MLLYNVHSSIENIRIFFVELIIHLIKNARNSAILKKISSYFNLQNKFSKVFESIGHAAFKTKPAVLLKFKKLHL